MSLKQIIFNHVNTVFILIMDHLTSSIDLLFVSS